jgi:hypothetical protein
MEIKENNIIFLLGAGCSKEAEIPISNEMVSKVERKLLEETDWKTYTDLYFYLRSSIDYSEGIFGNFGNAFNIEKLLIVMGQIEQRDKNIIYPFIGSWNIRLPEVAGKNFERITELKTLINKELYKWVTPKDLLNKASYYEGFVKIATEVGKTIRVFSLNYDQCFEKVIGEDNVEQGFDPKTFEWQQANFEEDRGKLFKLYKLHGSINWFTDKQTGKLMHSNHPIENDPQLIFGIDTKLRSNDPYFYYTSEFRRLLLSPDCKLIVTIGYSYADPYISNLIAQAIINNPSRQVLNITYLDDKDSNFEKNKTELTTDITQTKLDLKFPYNKQGADQFILRIEGAKDFLTKTISTEFFTRFIKDDTEAPFNEN